jgi:hypothetical protein
VFDQKEIIRKISRQWVRKGQLTQKDWTLIQARAASGGQPLDEALLSSGLISEEQLLQSLKEELGCRLWSTQELEQEFANDTAPRTELDIAFLTAHRIVPLSWSHETGLLHLIMPRLPGASVFEHLRNTLAPSKLHFELANTQAVFLVQQCWFQGAASENETLGLGSATPGLSSTVAISPFDMPTIRQRPDDTTKAQPTHTSGLPSSPGAHISLGTQGQSYQGDGETIRQQPPKPYSATPEPETFEDEPNPADTFRANHQNNPIPAQWQEEETPAYQPHHEEDTPTYDPYHEEDTPIHQPQTNAATPTPASLIDVDDDEFFLDYHTPSSPPEQDTSTPPPAASPIKLDKWSEPEIPATPPPVVLDLLEELIDEPTPPPSSAPKPTPPPGTAPVAQPKSKSIFPTGDDFFAVSDKQPARSQVRAPSSPPNQHAKLKPLPQSSHKSRAASSHQNQRAGGKGPKKPAKNPAKSLDYILTHVILGNLMKLINIALRLGIIGLVGYLLWWLFWPAP